MPISAIANFKPVVIEDLSEAALKTLLEQHPYRHFPVVENGRLRGIAARTEIEEAVFEHRPVKLEIAHTGRPSDSIRDSQNTFIESSTGTVVLTDKADGVVLAVVTLHDILRAQVSMSERESHG